MPSRLDLDRLRAAEDALPPEQRVDAINKRLAAEKREKLIKQVLPIGKRKKVQAQVQVIADAPVLTPAQQFEQQLQSLADDLASKTGKGKKFSNPGIFTSTPKKAYTTDTSKAYDRGSILTCLFALGTCAAIGLLWLTQPDVVIFNFLPDNERKEQEKVAVTEKNDNIKHILSGDLIKRRGKVINRCTITDIKRFRVRHPVSGGGRWHNGIDFVCPQMPHALYAPFDGKLRVLSPSASGGGGLVLRLTSNDRKWMVQIMHADSGIRPGLVKAGQFIGKGGALGGANMGRSTAPHTHLEIAQLKGGKRIYRTPTSNLMRLMLTKRKVKK